MSCKISPWKAATSRLGNQRGVSLIETITALSLFAISAATMGDFLTHQIRAAGSNTNYTVAHEIGVEELEHLRSLLYEQMDGGTREVQKGGMLYQITTSVEDNVPEPNMKSISVDIVWNEPGGQRHVVVETIYTAVTR